MLSLIQRIKDPVSCLTHLAGAFFAIIALILMLLTANAAVEVIAFSVFGVTMFLMYMSSAVYHMIKGSDELARILRKVDHIMIFLFIAGTFTPFTLLVVEAPAKWTFFGLIWGIAIAGVFFKVFWLHAPAWLSIALYLGMGWLGLLILPYAFASMPATAANWIIAGGVSYTIGAVIYGLKKPNPIPDWFGFHEIWHLFVMGGTFCHFWAIYNYLPIT
ncbi:MAG: hemolysin III family protein [Balneolales bacterium]|nr:hemolysin III family protein [Balneolales bacterium]